MQPKVLLMDEPFGALDALTRAHLQDSVMEIHATLGNTVMMITHDVDEAVLLSDRVVMMTNGPAATIGEILAIDLPRPRRRLELATDPEYARCRARRARIPLRRATGVPRHFFWSFYREGSSSFLPPPSPTPHNGRKKVKIPGNRAGRLREGNERVRRRSKAVAAGFRQRDRGPQGGRQADRPHVCGAGRRPADRSRRPAARRPGSRRGGGAASWWPRKPPSARVIRSIGWDEVVGRAEAGQFPKGIDVFLTKYHGLFYRRAGRKFLHVPAAHPQRHPERLADARPGRCGGCASAAAMPM